MAWCVLVLSHFFCASELFAPRQKQMNLPFFHQSVADCEAAFANAPNENAAEVWAFFGGAIRIEGSLLFAMGLSSVYALTVPLQKREALAVFIGIASVLCALADANAAGLLPQYGGVPAVTTGNGSTEGLGVADDLQVQTVQSSVHPVGEFPS